MAFKIILTVRHFSICSKQFTTIIFRIHLRPGHMFYECFRIFFFAMLSRNKKSLTFNQVVNFSLKRVVDHLSRNNIYNERNLTAFLPTFSAQGIWVVIRFSNSWHKSDIASQNIKLTISTIRERQNLINFCNICKNFWRFKFYFLLCQFQSECI